VPANAEIKPRECTDLHDGTLLSTGSNCASYSGSAMTQLGVFGRPGRIITTMTAPDRNYTA
jgi:hypothetical protein